jgi:hypothetical protein
VGEGYPPGRSDLGGGEDVLVEDRVRRGGEDNVGVRRLFWLHAAKGDRDPGVRHAGDAVLGDVGGGAL